MIEVAVDGLSTNELSTLSYNVSAYIVSSSASVQSLGMRKFTTLMEEYVPHSITNVSVVEWIPVADENDVDYSHLKLVIQWQPAIDRTCSYDMAYHGFFGDEADNRIDEREISMDELYQYTIQEKFNFGDEYSVGIRGKNTQNHHIQGTLLWFKFTAPSSVNDKRPKEKIKIQYLNVSEIQNLGDKHFNVNVTWATNIPCEMFNISIHDVDENYHNTTSEFFLLDGYTFSFVFEDIQLLGSNFRVELIAFKENQNATIDHIQFLPIYEKDSLDDILFYSLVAFMFLLLIALFKVWKGRIDSVISILAQKRMERMDLETVKTISTGTVLDTIAELTKDTSMEIETENVTMLESLGEGAFGLVNKALMIRNGEKQYVAVKMLKSKATLKS